MMARVLLADFDWQVRWIYAQLFRVIARVDGRVRCHVPDLLLVTAAGTGRLVNVKPAARLADPKIAETLAWPGVLAQRRGWAYDTTRLLLNTTANRQAWQALRNYDRPIDLIYTPLADPAFLTNNPDSHQQMTALRGLFDNLGFARTDLDAGWSIMAHDAVLTVAQAVRSASGDAGRIPPPQSVAEQLGLMSTPSTAAPGASGPIRLDQATGNRYDLRIPVLRFVPGGQPKLLAVYTPKHP